MKDLNYVEPERITVEVEGKSYSAKYFVKDNLIRVTSWDFGTETTQVGNSDPKTLAETMFIEQIKKNLKK